ncbi:MAG TPA: hypothetical protein VHX38_18620 [Pseudonocardiaceae bacterium]|nr:hypothetical protein [Pseudonocardiaceae bacterium]
MIPPRSAPASDKDRERLADVVAGAHQNFAAPPVPIHRIDRADMVITSRTTWTQTAPEHTVVDNGIVMDDTEIHRVIAREASATPNPIRDLAAVLTRFADQLDTQGVVPLGIHVCTAHVPDHSTFAYSYEPRLIAQVVTTIRGVRREWIEQHHAVAEPAQARACGEYKTLDNGQRIHCTVPAEPAHNYHEAKHAGETVTWI